MKDKEDEEKEDRKRIRDTVWAQEEELDSGGVIAFIAAKGMEKAGREFEEYLSNMSKEKRRMLEMAEMTRMTPKHLKPSFITKDDSILNPDSVAMPCHRSLFHHSTLLSSHDLLSPRGLVLSITNNLDC